MFFPSTALKIAGVSLGLMTYFGSLAHATVVDDEATKIAQQTIAESKVPLSSTLALSHEHLNQARNVDNTVFADAGSEVEVKVLIDNPPPPPPAPPAPVEEVPTPAVTEATQPSSEEQVKTEEPVVQEVKEEAKEEKVDVSASGVKKIALDQMSSMGWGSEQFKCLESLWEKESNWNYQAKNKSSGAYGIPQSLPGNKMASAGDDWQSNPATQIKWGLGYIEDRYGSPCSAWGHSQDVGWY